MASKQSGMVTVAAPGIRIPRVSAWTIGMLVVGAAGFVLGQLLTDTSEPQRSSRLQRHRFPSNPRSSPER
jgi:hypothetical protein